MTNEEKPQCLSGGANSPGVGPEAEPRLEDTVCDKDTHSCGKKKWWCVCCRVSKRLENYGLVSRLSRREALVADSATGAADRGLFIPVLVALAAAAAAVFSFVLGEEADGAVEWEWDKWIAIGAIVLALLAVIVALLKLGAAPGAHAVIHDRIQRGELRMADEEDVKRGD